MNFEEYEIDLILKALRYTTEHGYTRTESQEEVDEYQAMRHLIRLLDPQPVKKEGWMVVWDGTGKYCKTSVIEDKEEADRLLGSMGGYPNVRLIRVTWEE